MKSSFLRTPLINSAILVAVFALLVYFTLTSPTGSIWGSFGAIILLIFRAVQLTVGLALAFIVCLAVLIGIFLGAVALFDRASASRMYEGLRQTMLCWVEPFAELRKSSKKGELHTGFHELGEKLKFDFTHTISSTRSELVSIHGELEGKLQALQSRLSATEEIAGQKATVEQFEALSDQLGSVAKTLAAGEGTLKALQDKVDLVFQKANAMDANAILGDVPTRLAALEQQEPPVPVDLQPVEDKISTLQAEMNALKARLEERLQEQAPAAEKPAAVDEKPKETKKSQEKEVKESADTAEPEHRLLSYFGDKAEKDKLAALVKKTLKKDMTYAQVTDFLIKEMGEKGGQVISEHPSLAKDYIRQCRRNT